MWKVLRFAAVAVGITLLTAFSVPTNARAVGPVRLPLQKGAEQPAASPKQSCFRLVVGNSVCSATCIASINGKSLLVSCNHCFAHQRFPGWPFPRANYPQPCKIQTLDRSKTYDGTAIDGSSSPDCAFIVVNDTLGAAGSGLGAVAVGSPCEHWGIASGHATGTVRVCDNSGTGNPGGSFSASISSIPGDSGAGIFSNGELVAVNWGYYSRSQEGGTEIVYILRAASSSAVLSRDYAQLRDSIKGINDLPKLPVAPIRRIVEPVQPCPPGGCPIPPQRPVRFPILRRIFGS